MEVRFLQAHVQTRKGMEMYKIGDKVKVTNLILEEPCAEVEELRNKVGAVLNPSVDDEDYNGKPCKKVLVRLDKPVSSGSWPESYSTDFVFKPEELSQA